MGCDIHSHTEVLKNPDWGWELFPFKPFFDRDYAVFGFLANVRNYSDITPISEPRGIPHDVTWATAREHQQWGEDAHSESFLLLSELLAVNYDEVIEDRRCTRQIAPNLFHGGMTCDPGEGEKMTLREFLGEDFMRDLEILKLVGPPENVRVVFWFDN